MTQAQKKSLSSNVDSSLIPFFDTGRLLDAFVQHKQLFLFKGPRVTCIFRLLTIAELEAIRSMAKICNIFAIEDWVVSACSVYRSFTDETILAGTVGKISRAIIQKSDTSDENGYIAMLESYRAKTETLEIVSQSMINRVFPTLDTSHMSFNQQAKMLAISELMLNSKIDIGTKKGKKPGPRPAPGFTPVGAMTRDQILSESNADKPDFAKDNALLRDH